MMRRVVDLWLAIIFLFAGVDAAHAQVNLLANGGLEKDSDGDGVPDGWLSHPHHFSGETLEEVQAYIANLPSHEELLKGTHVLARDGWTVGKAAPDGTWTAHEQTPKWYDGLRDGTLLQNSRFGQRLLPKGLELGITTLVIHNHDPHEQTVSEPIPVKPNTGYRLSYWFRMSGGSGEAIFHVLGADAPRNDTWPRGGTEASRQLISHKDLGWAWLPNWTKYEISFRTGPEETVIQLRPWIYFRSYDDPRRMWYDNFCLVEDDSVRVGDIGDPVNPEPQWPQDLRERGYAVIGRPALPLTSHNYMPRPDEIDAPLRLNLAAGETGSAVIFVRSLGEDLKLRAVPGLLKSPNGYGLANDYGARSIYLRAAEETRLSFDGQCYLIRPEFLLHTNELALTADDGGQFWLTIAVPEGTPPGQYNGQVTVTPVGVGADKVTKLPVVLTVPDLVLSAADVAFGTWRDTKPSGGKGGVPYVLPGSDQIYLLDQQRHGMNTVGTYCCAQRKDKDGNFHLSFNELDVMVQNVQRAGLCRNHPLLLHTWREEMVGGEFGQLAGGTQAIMDIYRHAQEQGWPTLLFYVLDEPGGGELAKRVIEVMQDYTPARENGVQTVTAGPDPRLQGHFYDVWIAGTTGKWEELFPLAQEHGSEVWMYECGWNGRNPLLERFYAGLWTWWARVKGNMAWSYGWYVRINDQGLPESKLAWEGRLAGVNDYRYLQTLEQTLAAAATSGQEEGPAIQAARRFLERLQSHISLGIWEQQPAQHSAEVSTWNPVPAIGPEDYERIRHECAEHIIAVRRESGA